MSKRASTSSSWVTYDGVVMFNSSSASGWQFEQYLSASDSHSTSTNAASARKGLGSYYAQSNRALDMDDKRVIVGGKGGYSSAGTMQENGRVSIFASSSTMGWFEEDQIDLFSAGFKTNVGSSYPQLTNFSGGDWYDGTGEWRLYKHFGYHSCAISGSYFASSALSEVGSTSGTDPVAPAKVFIFKSSSASGWELESQFSSPNGNTTSTVSDSRARTHVNFDEFGHALVFNRAVPGALATSSPSYNCGTLPTSTNHTFGRMHLFKSSSASGWSISQNIDNPYSGSALLPDPNPRSNGQDDYYGYLLKPYETSGLLNSNLFGFDGSHLGVPFWGISEDENTSSHSSPYPGHRYGAIQILSGTIGHRLITVTQTVTESVEVETIIKAPTNFAPFVKAVNGPMNIRLQSGSNTPFSSEFGSNKNPS